jgi:hypothetical protein
VIVVNHYVQTLDSLITFTVSAHDNDTAIVQAVGFDPDASSYMLRYVLGLTPPSITSGAVALISSDSTDFQGLKVKVNVPDDSTDYAFRLFQIASFDTVFNSDTVQLDSIGHDEIAYDPSNWYIDSENGDDGNSGHHPDSAFQTLSAIEGETINVGDTIYLVAGSVWRETLDINENGSSGNLITFLKYGSGANPQILGSNQAISWTETETSNVWQTGTSLTNNSDEYYPGRIYFIEDDSASWGTYHVYGDLSELTQEYDYTVDGTTHYVYSTTDPDAAYDAIEVTQRQYCVTIGETQSYLEFNGVDLKYSRQRGLNTTYPVGRGGTDLVFRNCSIGYIGGKSSGSAHGIEVFHSNLLVENCFFSDCGRRAISLNTYTSPEGGRNISNIIIRDNTFKRGFHTTSMDLSVMNQSGDTVRGVYFYHNIVDDSEILAADIPDNPSNQVFIQEGDSNAYLFDSIYIVGNVFAKAQTRWINFDDTYGAMTAHIYQNTFAGFNLGRTTSPYGGISLNDLDSLVLYNNVFYDNFGDNAIENNIVHGYGSPLTGYNKDYNLYWSLYPGSDRSFISIDEGAEHRFYDVTEWEDYKTAYPTHEANSPTPADPYFKDFSGGDYTLEDSSDAVGAGDVLDYIIITDVFGVVDTVNKYDINDSILSRTTPDLGAYQTQQDTNNQKPVVTNCVINGEPYIDSLQIADYDYSDADGDLVDSVDINWYLNDVKIADGDSCTPTEGDTLYYFATPYSITGTWANPGDSVKSEEVILTVYIDIDPVDTFTVSSSADTTIDMHVVGFDTTATRHVVMYALDATPSDTTDGTKQFAFNKADTAAYNDTTFYKNAGADTTYYFAIFSFYSTQSESNDDTVRVGAPAAPAASYSDDFNDYTAGADLDGQGSWAQEYGSIIEYSDRARGNNDGSYSIYYYDDDVTDDQWAQADTIINNGAYRIGVAVRVSTDGSSDCYFYAATGDARFVGKVVNGTETILGNTGSTGANQSTMRIEVDGTTITCYYNGSVDTELSNGNGVYTDSDISSGKIGLYMRDNTYTYVDDWSGGDLE